TLYNAGSVVSIAALAFLGAKHRRVSASGTFMFHRSQYGQVVPADSTELQDRVRGLIIDDQRTLAILKGHVKLEAPANWDDLKSNELWFTQMRRCVPE